MPVYEYRCLNCRKSFEILLRYTDYGGHTPSCPHCQSDKVRRKIGRIRFARSADSRIENLSDPSNLDALEDNPRALGQMMRKMSEETGEEMGPEFDEVVHRLESGQHPEQIEKDLPDLGGAEAGMGGAGDEMDDY